MKFEIGKIYTLKFNSGEEMVAKVQSENTDNTITVSNPVSIAPSAQGMGLVPSMFTADPDQIITINTNSVAMYGITEDNVQTKYIQATTGIQLPEKKIITG